ncbi:MAG: 30S ribosomal protein S7 [Verrucomicrobia bacterium]|jgi:small subunit ribosomal protein S7|nr:30S ribosomal protein S7 [Verrucomicrobiota bacterium]
MSRRGKTVQRRVEPDTKYNSLEVEKFITRVMRDGKKTLARKIVYQAMENFAKKVKIENPLEAFEKALENAMPLLEVKSRRIGGATYQVPVEIHQSRRRSLGMKWLITNAKSKAGKNMIDGLTQELQDCFNNQGSTIKKRDDVHRMAEANKAFAHYRW